MSPGLARSGIRGAWFSGSSTIATTALQGLKLVVLARVLQADDFGVAGMAMVVVAMATLLSDLGIGGAVIQREEVPDAVLARLYGVSLAVGVGLCALLIGLAPVVAWIYRDPRVGPVLAVLATMFLVQPWGALHQALAEKRLAFKRLGAIEVTSSAVGTAAAIAAAVAGAGVWALVADLVTTATVKAALLVAQGRGSWRGRPVLERGGLRHFLRFGAYNVGQRTANYATANVDYFLIGTLLGAHALGVYKMAYELATLVPGRLNVVVSRVFFPVMTRFAADRVRFRDAFMKMQETAIVLGCPLVVGTGLVASVAVPNILGARWIESVPLLRILWVVGLGRVVAGTIGPALLAAGRPDLGLRWSLTLVAIQVPAVWLAVSRGGLLAVAWTFAVLQTLYVVLNYRLLVRTLFGPCLPPYLRAVVPPLAMGAAMAAAVTCVSWVAGEAAWPALLALQVGSGALVYGALLAVFRRGLVEAIALLPRHDGQPS